MTALALAIIVVAAIIAIAIIYRPSTAAHSRELDARGQDLQAYTENLERLVAAYSEQLTRLANRTEDELRILIAAAQGREDRLLTALLAIANPQAAITVGRIDQAQAKAAEAITMHDFMEQTRESETVDGEGKPIVLVGMGG